METIRQSSAWFCKPKLVGCSYTIGISDRHPFPCFAITEKSDGAPDPDKELRIYPTTDAGATEAKADLRLIENAKREEECEIFREEMHAELGKRFCRYCRYFPKTPRDTPCGKHFVCQCESQPFSGFYLCEGIPVERVIHKDTETCEHFDLANEYRRYL